MGSFASQNRTFFYNLKRYGFTFSDTEIKQILITVLVVAFVWSFNKWGDESFDILSGVTNFVLGAVFALIALFLNQAGQRMMAVHYGYDPIYQYGMIGLMIALVITFASRGLLIFFIPGAINLRHLTASRLGEFRYYTNDWEWAKIGFFGPFMNMLFAMIFSVFKETPIFRQLMIMNLMFAIYSLIPLPGNLGLYLFYPHIYFWSFVVGFVAAGTIMVFFLNPIFTFFLSFIFGIVAIYYHYAVKDKKF